MINARNSFRGMRVVALATLVLVLATCASPPRSREKQLTETLRTYAATIRWGSVEQAEAFVDPVYRAAHPLTQLDLDRYKQVQFASYSERAPFAVNDTEVRQVVEISIVNINSQTSRSFIDQQIWKYDETAKRWLLTTGLPDITRRE